MSQVNRFAKMVKMRTAADPNKRRKLDDYETPASAIWPLLEDFEFNDMDVLEPAAGSGRIGAIIRNIPTFTGKVIEQDIKTGQNFLLRTEMFDGHIITNPPYRDGLAEKFSRKALELASGKVAMLMNNSFLWGSRRAAGLFAEYKPELIIAIPWRVLFINGDGIEEKSQFFSHAWIIWPEAEYRDRYRGPTRFNWAQAA